MASTIGLLFPGQGSQSVGMGRALYEANALVRQLYEKAGDVLGYDVGSLCFDGPSDKLNLTEYTQPALLVTSVAALRLLEATTIEPAAVAGHSLGEYSAIVAAHGLAFPDAVGLVQKRGQYMANAVPAGSGLVAAILGLSNEVVQDVCAEAQSEGVVAPANFNCAGQVVIAGQKGAVERAIELAKGKGCRRAIPLPVSVPVHTPLMQEAANRLATDVQSVELVDLPVPLVNNVDAQALRLATDVRSSLIRQLPSPVLWEQSMRTMWEMGITTFVEVGPGTVLTGLAKRIVPEATLLNVQDPQSLESTVKQLGL